MSDPTVKDIVGHAASGDWSIPEFQREFEWNSEKVALLCDSLYTGLPVGILTTWNTDKYNEPQHLTPSGRIPLWIVDGQQRITSLCIIAGKKPNWLGLAEWDKEFNDNRLYLIVDQNGRAKIGKRAKKAAVMLPIDSLISETPADVSQKVSEECAKAAVASHKDAINKAIGLAKVMERTIPVAEMSKDKPIEEVADTFRRLNQQGTKLREAQIMLAYVSQYNPSWVRESFYPFLVSLADKGDWELDPAHALQIATIVLEGKARVGQATPGLWETTLKSEWPRLRSAIEEVLLQLIDRGITADMIPSSYTLIALAALNYKFSRKTDDIFPHLFRWFLLANFSGRYSDAPLEQLSYDGTAIFKASNIEQALEGLSVDWDRSDVANLLNRPMRDNSAQALLLHWLLWNSEAKDWLRHISIPTLTRAPDRYELHWHHILPKDFGRRGKYADYNHTANVTRLCGVTNVDSLRTKPPWVYVPEFQISLDSLREHLIPQQYAAMFVKGQASTPAQFRDFLTERTSMLVDATVDLLALPDVKEVPAESLVPARRASRRARQARS
ncbi:MAG: DUF262 domain-containing protein [Dehalococcoidia bacterium]|nr:DUF262 domain-containing protein [Dehalococcoidia bacterium]